MASGRTIVELVIIDGSEIQLRGNMAISEASWGILDG